MGSFNTIDFAATGVRLGSFWLDTIAHNMANSNTVVSGDDEPFRAHMVIAQEQSTATGRGTGVQLVGVGQMQGEAAQIWDPSHPLANEDGIVQMPVMDVAGQMTDLIIATRSYQANLSVIQSGREAYQAALRIGRQ